MAASAAASRDIRKQLNIVTECAVCTDTFRDPRLLPCGHTFCLECIVGLCLGKLPRQALPCPLCRQQFQVPSGGAHGLPKNLLVGQLKDVVDVEQSQYVKDNLDAHCEICSDETSSDRKKAATMLCSDCAQTMCDACADGHRRQRLSRSHELIKISECENVDELLVNAASKYCAKHQDEVLKWYCLECKESTCGTCFIQSHKSHDYSDIISVADERRKIMNQDIKMVVETVAACRGIIQEQEEKYGKLSSRLAVVKREICDYAELLKQNIEREKYILLKEVDTHEKDIFKQMNHMVAEAEQHNSCKNAEVLIMKGTAHEVMQHASLVRDRVANDLTKLNVIRKAINDLISSVIVTFTPATSPAQMTAGRIGQVHRIDRKTSFLKWTEYKIVRT